MSEDKKVKIMKARTYARQQLIDGWDQSIMDTACILIIGVGALRIL